ncbi:MAG: hypothetical protein IJ657_01490 [Acidaminococcaceae bacterium]|nr:hypothetical protein [Acidaminococcaceae bacterium]
MKKIFAVAVAVMMMISVVLGCSNDKQAAPSAGQQTKVTETAGSASVKKADSNVKAKDKQEKAVSQKKEAASAAAGSGNAARVKVQVEKGKAYTDKDHVAAYIHVYKTLPPNYITKGQATKLGWKTKGTLDKVAPGKSIGGDRFGNYEKQLPDKQGRTWTECDIDYVKGNRNAKRICFSNDGLIYYSGSHYQKFERLY